MDSDLSYQKYMLYKNKYLKLKNNLSQKGGVVEWGIGLENEVAIVKKLITEESGTSFASYLDSDQKTVYSFEEKKTYKILEIINITELLKSDKTLYPSTGGTRDGSGIYSYIFSSTHDPAIELLKSDIEKKFNIYKDYFLASPSLSETNTLKNFIIQNMKYGTLFEDTTYGISMVEIVTFNYKNTSIDKITNELLAKRDLTFNIIGIILLLKKVIRSIDEISYFDILDNKYYEFVKMKKESGYRYVMDYLGSYHINLSLPVDIINSSINYGQDPANRDIIFKELHKRWAIAIQFIEPLLVATYSIPDFHSIGDNHKYARASFRLQIVTTSFLNSSDIMNKGISIDRTNPSPNLLMFTATDNNLKTNFGETYGKMRSNIKTYFNPSLDNPIGADFRRAGDTGDTSGREAKKNLGFEFRILDVFDPKYLNEIMAILYVLFIYIDIKGINNEPSNNLYKAFTDNPYNNPVISKNIVEIFKEGWNTVISNDYVLLLNDNLKLNLISGSIAYHAFDLLDIIYGTMLATVSESINNPKYVYFKTILPTIIPKYLTNLNRSYWRMIYNNSQCSQNIDKLLLNHKKVFHYGEFEKIVKSTCGELIAHDTNDIMYALVDNKKLNYQNGIIRLNP
ncbi:MAG: hypothetical protein Edafosvirus11_25 [Edafosvirus sp.]|uniref:Uncharacterized protein n=1 Tax=Edafosvirus sp. TaxID=2487765 RepID=A0A3G4ZU11_9VIRU|nr:MAG: hypothetical protein Edafosvirus11_25 [Edafosvirus sp.]